MSLVPRVIVVLGVIGALVAIGTGAVVADPQHEHPDEIDDGDDLEGIQQWFGNRMGDIHVDCAEGLQFGNFDACEDLDDEYESLLERYVSVERDTTDEDDQQGERFEETREQQQELALLLEEFWETYDEYQDARDAGDDERARELARELQGLADRIEELGGDLAVNFRLLDPTVDADLNATASTTQETAEETVMITDTVVDESFESTTLSITADERATFTDPATVQGVLRDADGEPVPNARLVLEDDDRTISTRSNATGEYSFDYRPVLTAPGETVLTVRYEPETTSPFLESNATTTVDVGTTQSSVSITESTAEAGFGDTVRVRGAVQAEDVPVAGVPVTIRIDNESVAVVETDSDGQFDADSTLPAEPPAGEATITVEASEQDRAVLPSQTSTALSVRETPTEMSVTTTTEDGETVIAGQLRTTTNQSVGTQPLTVTVAGDARTVRTNADGNFSLTVESSTESRTVVAAYESPETNLGPSQAETTAPPVSESAAETETPTESDTVPAAINRARGLLEQFTTAVRNSPVLAAVVAIGTALGVAVAALLWRRYQQTADTAASPPLDPELQPAITAVSSADDPSVEKSTVLDAAYNYLETSPETAVQAGYAAVRSSLNGDAADRTHWEFYHEQRDELDEHQSDALRSLTEAFESAAFAPTKPDTEQAKAALENAKQCLGVEEATEPAD